MSSVSVQAMPHPYLADAQPAKTTFCTLANERGTDREDVMKGFKAFLLRGNVVDLAVAVIIGVAFNNIVQALVKDVITPLIAAAGGRPNFAKLVLTVGSTKVRYGLLLNAVIAFLIVATVIYFLLVAPMGKLVAFAQRKKEATEKDCPECLS